MWASAGQDDFKNELSALTSAITQYGTAFTDLVVGISVGSEDLYRVSSIGIQNKAGQGADAATVVSYINQTRTAIEGTSLSGASIGHVDTWTAWVDPANPTVISACDWIGMDAYPYFQSTVSNAVDSGKELFFEAYYNTTSKAGSKEVWITETGWPVSGPVSNLAVASISNAKTYWDDVACAVLGKINTYWYTLQDAAPTTPSPSFGLVGQSLTTTPLYDLTCPASGSSSSSVSSSAGTSTTAVASSVASSYGASTVETSSAGSGPIVISAASSGYGGSSNGTAVAAPTSALYTTASVSVGSGSISLTTYAIATSAGAVGPIGTGIGGSGSSTTFANGTVSTPTLGSSPVGSSTTKAAATQFTGGATINAGSVGGIVGAMLAVVAAL